jgi:cytochrome P450
MTTPTESRALLLRLLRPSTRANPYPVYHELRKRGPLHIPWANLTVFSSFRDCNEVLRHPASATGIMFSRPEIAAGAQPRPFGKTGLLFLDPPDHARLRQLVSKAFAPKAVTALEPDISALVSSLLDDVEAAGTFDVIADLAYPLPVAVICRLLGVPIEDEPEFSRASAPLARSVDPFIAFARGADGTDERRRAGLWLYEYLDDLIEQRRGAPGEDLISALIAVEESGDQLTKDEIIATCTLVLIAGHENTANLIANAILAMLRHPGQWSALGADPGRVSAVIEETLRYDPPNQLMARIAGEDMTIGDVTVPKGGIMMLLQAAAQRDPNVNERPDEFDPDRETIQHLAFGHGPYFCLGAPLARLEASIALSAVTSRFPNARLDGEPLYKPNVTLRGMSKLDVTVKPGGRSSTRHATRQGSRTTRTSSIGGGARWSTDSASNGSGCTIPATPAGR